MQRIMMTLTLCILSFAAFAQSNDLQTREQARAEAGKAIDDPGLTATVAQPHSQVSLVSSNEGDTQVRAEVGLTHETVKSDWRFALRAQGPVNKGGGDTKLASLTGLGTGSTAGFHVTRFGYGSNYDPDTVAAFCEEQDAKLPPPPRVNVEKECTLEGIQAKLASWSGPEDQKKVVRENLAAVLEAASRSVCAEYNKSGSGPSILCDHDADIRAALTSAGSGWPAKLDEATNKGLRELCENLNVDVGRWGFLGGLDGCDTDDVARVSASLAAELSRRLQLRPTLFGFAFELQNQTYKYAPGATLDEVKETHQNLSVSAHWGRLFMDSDWYVGVSGAIERVYEGGPAQQICGPIAGTDLTTCKSIARTAPGHDDNEIVSLEARHFVTDSLAFQGRVSHDFSDDVNGAELIAYLFTHEKKGLNGGINLGYRDDEKDPTLTVFIGVPFSLFGEE